MTNKTPTGASRDQLTHHIWVNADASEDEVKDCIKACIGLADAASLQYLYAQGKNLRVANFSDVENCVSWDLESLRALMGSGALYVLNLPPQYSSGSESDTETTQPVRLLVLQSPQLYCNLASLSCTCSCNHAVHW